MNTDILEKRLNGLSYPELFSYGSRSLANGIWRDEKHQTHLGSIIQNPDASLHAKFLSAELLKYFAVPIDTSQYAQIVIAYVFALEQTAEGYENSLGLNGNLWGFLYEEDDPGLLGNHLIAFGAYSIPYLRELLDNEDNIWYEGSEEATVGNGYEYRVKDFAAFYISKINNIPIAFYQDIEERDKEIERFKMQEINDKNGRD